MVRIGGGSTKFVLSYLPSLYLSTYILSTYTRISISLYPPDALESLLKLIRGFLANFIFILKTMYLFVMVLGLPPVLSKTFIRSSYYLANLNKLEKVSHSSVKKTFLILFRLWFNFYTISE